MERFREVLESFPQPGQSLFIAEEGVPHFFIPGRLFMIDLFFHFAQVPDPLLVFPDLVLEVGFQLGGQGIPVLEPVPEILVRRRSFGAIEGFPFFAFLGDSVGFLF